MTQELSDDMRKRIRSAFRSYSGRLTSGQINVLEDLDIQYGINGKNHIYFDYQGRKVTSSGSPGDWRVGRNLATKLIRLVQGEPITF